MESQIPLNNIPNDIRYYFMDIWSAFPIKAGIAAVIALAAKHFGLVVEVLYAYCALMFADLITGIIRAIVYRQFCISKINRWVLKVGVQFFVATIIGVFFFMFEKTSGISIYVINWIFLMYAISDLTSTLENLENVGIKLPAPIKLIIKLLRKKTAIHLATIFDNPEAAKEIEEALGKKQTAEVQHG